MSKATKGWLTEHDIQKLSKIFLTKQDFLGIGVTKEEFQRTALTKEEFQRIGFTKEEFSRIGVTKEEFNKKTDHMLSVMDTIVTELQEIRHENFAFHRRFERTDEKLADHEKRIGTLEKAA